MLPFSGSAMVHVVGKPEASCCWHAAQADRKLHRGEATGTHSDEFAALSVVLKTLIRIFDAADDVLSVDSISEERAPASDNRDNKDDPTAAGSR